MGIPEGRRPLARSTCRWDFNIKIVLPEIGWVRGMDLSGSG
jgi:hypothetical protein